MKKRFISAVLCLALILMNVYPATASEAGLYLSVDDILSADGIKSADKDILNADVNISGTDIISDEDIIKEDRQLLIPLLPHA